MRFTVEGTIVNRYGAEQGWAVVTHPGTVSDGVMSGCVVSEIGKGECPEKPNFAGTVLCDIVNMHTHCADYGFRVREGMTLEELVAPPNGLKHRYLAETPDSVLRKNMSAFSVASAECGSTAFVDFREGGAKGCAMLREASPDAVILGRPLSPEFDSEEIAEILDVADGIGLSAVSDMDHEYVEKVADAVRERGMIFALHASERVREDIDFILSLDPAFVVHMCKATESDIAKCAEAEVPIVVCPTSNRYFGLHPPIAVAQECGADLALGTDNGMLCGPDMIAESRIYATEAAAQGGDSSDSLRVLTRLSTKILNFVETNGVRTDPKRATVLPSSGPDLRKDCGIGRNQRKEMPKCHFKTYWCRPTAANTPRQQSKKPWNWRSWWAEKSRRCTCWTSRS